jgi:hypothetical protein
LVVVHPRCEDRSRSVLEKFTHDAHALLGRLSRGVHSLGCSLAKVPMVIDEGISHIGVRKP